MQHHAMPPSILTDANHTDTRTTKSRTPPSQYSPIKQDPPTTVPYGHLQDESYAHLQNPHPVHHRNFLPSHSHYHPRIPPTVTTSLVKQGYSNDTSTRTHLHIS